MFAAFHCNQYTSNYLQIRAAVHAISAAASPTKPDSATQLGTECELFGIVHPIRRRKAQLVAGLDAKPRVMLF
jgi:hypothetical protein